MCVCTGACEGQRLTLGAFLYRFLLVYKIGSLGEPGVTDLVTLAGQQAHGVTDMCRLVQLFRGC